MAQNSLNILNYNQNKSQHRYKYSTGKLVNIKRDYTSSKGYYKYYIKNYYNLCTGYNKNGMARMFKMLYL